MSDHEHTALQQRLARAVDALDAPPIDILAAERRGSARRTRRKVLVAGVAALIAIAIAVPLALLAPLTDHSSGPASGGPTSPPASGLTTALYPIDASTGAVGARVQDNVLLGFPVAVAPDGSRIVFDRPFEGNEQLFLKDAASNVTRLTGKGKGGCTCGSLDPAWSPDGQRIAFAGIQDGNQDIYVLDLKSGAFRRLTRDVADEGSPTWSPDGSQIAFTRGDSPASSLWIVNVANDRPRAITDQIGAQDPAWSPRGDEIAFDRPNASGSGDAVWLVNSDGSGLRRLATSHLETNPAWSPDGTQIAFTTFRAGAQGGTAGIDVVDVATGQVRALATGFADPVWSSSTAILALRS